MKFTKISIAVVLAVCLLLTGCNNVEENNSSFFQTNSNVFSFESSDTQSMSNTSELINKPENQENLTETEKILKLLKDYANLYYGMQPSGYDELEKITDKSSKIYIDGKSSPFLKLINAPANTMTQLNDKLDNLVTNDLKKSFIDSIINNNYYYRIKDGEIYVTDECFAYGMGMGMDKLYLNSVEYPDEKTILINMTSFGDKNIWETEENIKNNCVVKVIKTNNGLRIDECDLNAVSFLYYYDDLTYGDITISFPES